MYGRAGLDRFRKAQSLEPFSLNANSTPAPSLSQKPPVPVPVPVPAPAPAPVPVPVPVPVLQHHHHHLTQIGEGQSTWQPPEWAMDPRPGVYYLEVLKEGHVLDRITLDRRRNIFGRQSHACDYVLDHQSVSRQHAVVVPHKNGRSVRPSLSYQLHLLYWIFFLLHC